jgi:hypothetical protein
MPFPTDSEDSSEEETPKPTKESKTRTEVKFERISQAMYKANEQKIKDGLRSNEAMINPKFPGGKPIQATRFPSSTPFEVYTLPAYTGSVDFVFPVASFPGGFTNFQDTAGERWKCVALWDGTSISYVANIAAEIRLCSELYTGSAKGKVRWEKAVEPRNNILTNFGSFVVSDRVLLERRKAHWPQALKALREACGIVSAVVEEEVLKAPVEKKEKTKAKKGTDAEPAAKKRKIEPYVQIKVANRLTFKSLPGEKVTVEEISAEGTVLKYGDSK